MVRSTTTSSTKNNPPLDTSFSRRDSNGGQVNNVIARCRHGRCSPTTNHVKKEADSTKKADMTTMEQRLPMNDCSCHSTDIDEGAGESNKLTRARDTACGASPASSVDDVDANAMDIDMDSAEDDDDLSATTKDDEGSAKSDCDYEELVFPVQVTRQQHPHMATSSSSSSSWRSKPLHSAVSTPPSATLSTTSASAFHCIPTSSSSSSSVAPSLAATTLSPACHRGMQRIIALNESAIQYMNMNTTTKNASVEDLDLAMHALSRAEWTRCHLVDELHQMNIMNNNKSKSKKKSTLLSLSSGSWGRGDLQQQHHRRQKYMRRFGSFSTSSVQQHQHKEQQDHPPQPTTAVPDEEDSNVARSSYIYQRMDFDEGMHSFVNLEPIHPSEVWTMCNNNRSSSSMSNTMEINPVIESTLVFNIAQIYRRNGDLDSASKWYDRALDVLKVTAMPATTQHQHGNMMMPMDTTSDMLSSSLSSLIHHPIVIPILHNIGQLQYRRGELPRAMETFELALKVAQILCHGNNEVGQQHLHVASALNCLGVLHYHDANSGSGDGEDESMQQVSTPSEQRQEQSDDSNSNALSSSSSSPSTQKAMDFFQRALSILRKLLGPNHVDVATILNNIGRIHVQLDEFDQALTYYEDALRIRRTSLGVDSLDYAASAFNAGQSFHQKGQLSRAKDLYHEFLRVALLKFGNSHRDVAVVLSGIAQIHQEKKEYGEAMELYEASLCAGKAALGENHSEIAMLLNRMGNFHFEQERLDEALRCYKRGLRIERKVLPPDHPNIIVTLSNLGEIHRQRNEWDEAAKMYGDCLGILRKKHDNKNHLDVASTLSTIGLIHDQRGDTCLSLHYLQDALLMRRQLLGNGHLDVSATLVYIGTILYRKSVFSVAIELFTESLRIRQASLGNDHRDVAFVLYNIALIHQQRGCYEEAIEAYSETLRIEKLVLGDTHRDVSMTLFKLGEVNKSAGDLEEALKCFETSLAVERSLSRTSDDATSSSINTADGHRRQPQQSPGSDHASMARALNEIGNIHLALGNVVPMMDALNEASRLYREAGLSPNNVLVSGHLYALEFSCPEAAPAA